MHDHVNSFATDKYFNLEKPVKPFAVKHWIVYGLRAVLLFTYDSASFTILFVAMLLVFSIR